MNSYLNHYGCPFYKNNTCTFSEENVTPDAEYQCQCSNTTIEDIKQVIFYFSTDMLQSMLRSIEGMPPSYITWQRKTAIEQILNSRKNENK